MLLPEARLETLLDQLATLPAGDRKAILARLSPRERQLVRARKRGTLVLDRPASPFSPDIAERVDAGEKAPMTDSGKAALVRALAADTGKAETPAPQESLIDRLWPGRGAA